MLSGNQNDIQNWYNYTPNPSPAEVLRLREIVGDTAYSNELLDFGIRPLSILDAEPQAQPDGNLENPFIVLDKHLSTHPLLVDVFTGFRFRYLQDEGGLVFDLPASSNFVDATELLMWAAHRSTEFPFERVKRPTYISENSCILQSDYVLPLTLHVSSRRELDAELNRLTELFCGRCPNTTKLWLRGQRCEYDLDRTPALCERIYRTPRQPSLLPSAGRYAIKNPDKMGFGISFFGPNHFWKKPFLIWLMRENADWFEHDRKALHVLTKALRNDDDEVFTNILMAIQMGHAIPKIAELGGGVSWPDQADDLRQWFFAHMKAHSLGITLQQYGYISSLLDLTEDLEVALYFTQAAMIERKIKKMDPESGRLIYVFAERKTGDFFRHREQLFWGDSDWVKALPPRLVCQKAGFMMGSTCRARNFYSNMIVAKIFLDSPSIQSSIKDEELFPSRGKDLLYSTLLDSRPPLEGLY